MGRPLLAVVHAGRPAGKCQRGASAEGVHRSTCYRWKRQVDRWGLEALNIACAVGPHLEQRPVAFSVARTGSGPRRISAELAREKWGGQRISEHGVWRVLSALGLNRLILNIVGRTLSSLASSGAAWRAATALPRQLASTRPASRRTPCRPEHARPSPACGAPGSSRRRPVCCRRREACGHVGARRRLGRHPDVRVPSSRFVSRDSARPVHRRPDERFPHAVTAADSLSEWRPGDHARGDPDDRNATHAMVSGVVRPATSMAAWMGDPHAGRLKPLSDGSEFDWQGPGLSRSSCLRM